MRLLGENFIEYIRDYYEAVMERVAALSCVNDDHLYRDPEYSWDEYIQA